MNVVDINLVQTEEIAGAVRTSSVALECEWGAPELGSPFLFEIAVYGERVDSLDLTADSMRSHLWGKATRRFIPTSTRETVVIPLELDLDMPGIYVVDAAVDGLAKNSTTVHLLPYHQ